MKGILLHGGHGTRLRPLTHTGPKQLLPIANKPMSEYCIESMKGAGVTEIAIIIGGIGSQKVKEYYGDGNRFGIEINYILQDFPRGIAHAISLCENFIGNEKFLVFLGDNITIVKKILSLMNKSEDLIEFVEDRPGHDFRYSMDSQKMKKELNWQTKVNFEEGIKKTVDWYLSNREWWKNIAKNSLNQTPWKI